MISSALNLQALMWPAYCRGRGGGEGLWRSTITRSAAHATSMQLLQFGQAWMHANVAQARHATHHGAGAVHDDANIHAALLDVQALAGRRDAGVQGAGLPAQQRGLQGAAKTIKFLHVLEGGHAHCMRSRAKPIEVWNHTHSMGLALRAFLARAAASAASFADFIAERESRSSISSALPASSAAGSGSVRA